MTRAWSAHVDQHVDPKLPLFDSRPAAHQIAIDNEQVDLGASAVAHEPLPGIAPDLQIDGLLPGSRRLGVRTPRLSFWGQRRFSTSFRAGLAAETNGLPNGFE
jgi:hypothetical protein